MVTSGYGMGKVWHNGRLEEDFEIIGKGDRHGLQLVVRDKDEIEYTKVPSEKLFEIVLQQTQPAPCLDKRIADLLESKPVKNSGKSSKSKSRKTKTKKVNRKSKRSSKRKSKGKS